MIFFEIAGTLCIVYYTVIIIHSGFKATFSRFWAGCGVFFWLLAAGLKRFSDDETAAGEGLFVIFAAAACIAALFFLFAEFLIIRAAFLRPADGADVMIILGAQVRGRVPSRSLFRRICAGAAYLKENPGTRVIVSGGKGTGEDISEALCMRLRLEDMGIDPQRILMEEHSTDTYENIKNSLALCAEDASIVIVTCGYHIFRAQALAKKQLKEKGVRCPEVSCLPVKSSPVMWVNYYTREFFAVLKYKMNRQL